MHGFVTVPELLLILGVGWIVVGAIALFAVQDIKRDVRKGAEQETQLLLTRSEETNATLLLAVEEATLRNREMMGAIVHAEEHLRAADNSTSLARTELTDVAFMMKNDVAFMMKNKKEKKNEK